MRFPFTFMGILSVGLGLWIVSYLLAHPTRDFILVGLEILPALALVAFGAWLLFRRLLTGRAA